MRAMACGRWVGVRCVHCGRAAVSDQGLRDVLGAESWFRHARLANRHACPACLEAVPSAQRSEYVRASASELGEPRRSVPTVLVAAQ